MRTRGANISHVDKQIQGFPCPLFQCIHGLLMQVEFRRIKERKMGKGRLGDWKKEVENSMAGDHGAVELLLQGILLLILNLVQVTCSASLHPCMTWKSIREGQRYLKMSHTSSRFNEKSGVLVSLLLWKKTPTKKTSLRLIRWRFCHFLHHTSATSVS